MAKLDDRLLINRTLAGDVDAFGVLVRQYQDRLYNSLVYLLRSQTDAEDVLQETMVLAFRRLGSYRGQSSFYTWLYRIGHNVAVTHLRRAKPMGSLDSHVAPGSELRDVREDLPAEQLEREELISQVHAALDRLNSEHREILVLREIEQMDYDQIATVLELPLGTVRSRLFRAREQLRQELSRVGPEAAEKQKT